MIMGDQPQCVSSDPSAGYVTDAASQCTGINSQAKYYSIDDWVK